MKEKFLIRCRETGLFYHPGIAGPWTDQESARRLDEINALWYRDHLAETKHCVHVVPEGWTAADEADPLMVRIRNFFVAIYHFFKH